MIRPCTDADFDSILDIVNDAAIAYRGVIPADRWKDPYMPAGELRHEIADGVAFCGYEKDGVLAGVMGMQEVLDVALIRHAYVRTELRGNGIGGLLLRHLMGRTVRPVLLGTWSAASWAVRFYEKHGFWRVAPGETGVLLKKYWNIPDRQVETSVVLADAKWFAREA